MKTESVEDFLKRGGRIEYVAKAEDPRKEDKALKVKMLAENWPLEKVKRKTK